MIQDNEVFNRIIRTEPMTFADALRICYQLAKEKKEEMDRIDIHSQGLSTDYQTVMFALEELFKRSPSEITNKFNEEL